MFIEERHELILERLNADKRVSVNDLASQFGVSIDSIRRDLSILEDKGLLKRTHGGAIPSNKVRENLQHKTAKDALLEAGEDFIYYKGIAKKAVEYISNGDTIFLGGTTIHYTMLEYLPDDINYTVVTNSIILANELKDMPNTEVYLVCGKVRDSGIIIDSIAVEFIKTIRLDINFTSGTGLSARHGLSNSTYEAAALGRATAEVSRKVICLSPHEKLGYEAFARVMDAKSIDVVITDKDAPEDEIRQLTDIGVDVVIV